MASRNISQKYVTKLKQSFNVFSLVSHTYGTKLIHIHGARLKQLHWKYETRQEINRLKYLYQIAFIKKTKRND